MPDATLLRRPRPGNNGCPSLAQSPRRASESCCRCRCRRRSIIEFAEGITPPTAGSFVRVPLGGRSLVGVVWDEPEDERETELAVDRLRTVGETLPLPPLASSLRRFVGRVAAYTMAPPGAVLRMSMSVAEAFQPLRPRRLCTISPAGLAALADTKSRKAADCSAPPGARNACATAFHCRSPTPLGLPAAATGVVRDLITLGMALERFVPAEPPTPPLPDWQAQRGAAFLRPGARPRAGSSSASRPAALASPCSTASPARARPKPISRQSPRPLRAGKQVLVLLPEIALGAQWLERFRAAFWRPAGTMAFGDRPGRAARYLARGRRWQGAGRRRRALGIVPAVSRTRPDRRR